jgi:hypothetical protein
VAYRRVGFGQTDAAGPCIPFTSWSDPLCLMALVEGDYALGDQRQVAPMITAAQAAAAAPGLPPDQSTIDSQDPDTTVDQILTQSQANANAAAVAAAAAQAAALAPVGCASNPTGFTCWWNTYGDYVIWGAVGIGALLVVDSLKK